MNGLTPVWPAGEVRRPFTLGRWIACMVAGESVGFLAPIAGLALSATLALNPWAAYALLVLLGAVEGTALGLGQAAGLRGTAGAVPPRPWVAMTAAGAAFAWALGMLPTTLSDAGAPLDFAQPGSWVALALGGLALLASIPVAQWTVVRRLHSGAWRWIPLNMAAWLAGLIFPFLPGPFVDAETPPAVLAVLFVVAGVAMAVTVATVIGVGLWRFLTQLS